MKKTNQKKKRPRSVYYKLRDVKAELNDLLHSGQMSQRDYITAIHQMNKR